MAWRCKKATSAWAKRMLAKSGGISAALLAINGVRAGAGQAAGMAAGSMAAKASKTRISSSWQKSMALAAAHHSDAWQIIAESINGET